MRYQIVQGNLDAAEVKNHQQGCFTTL